MMRIYKIMLLRALIEKSARIARAQYMLAIRHASARDADQAGRIRKPGDQARWRSSALH
jgi:hypothetical protein